MNGIFQFLVFLNAFQMLLLLNVFNINIWVFPKIGIPQNGWFIMEKPIKMDDLGVPLFLETPIYQQLIVPSVKGPTKNPTTPSSNQTNFQANWRSRLRNRRHPPDMVAPWKDGER